MKTEIYITEIRSIVNGEEVVYSGPYITAESQEQAQRFLDENDMGYIRVIGKLVNDIDMYLCDCYNISMN